MFIEVGSEQCGEIRHYYVNVNSISSVAHIIDMKRTVIYLNNNHSAIETTDSFPLVKKMIDDAVSSNASAYTR